MRVENIFWDWIYYANPCGDDCNLTSFKIFSTAPLNSLPSSMLSFHVPLHGGEKFPFLFAEDAKPQSTQLSPTLEFSEYLGSKNSSHQ